MELDIFSKERRGFVSPTIFRYKGYRFFFFSREEKRKHVHVSCANGEAKFWLEPLVALEKSCGLTGQQLRDVQKVIERKHDEIAGAWQKHFRR